MTTYAISPSNLSSIPHQPQFQLFESISDTARIDSYSENSGTDTFIAKNNETFTQNVIQSLQNLGLNSQDVDKNSALQVFVQNLYKALIQSGTQTPPPPAPPIANTDNILVPSSDDVVTLTRFSGGTNFRYSVDLSQAELGDNFANVAANIKTALDKIGQYNSSPVVFDLKVLTKSTNSATLAETNAALVTTITTSSTNPNYSARSIDTSFVSDSIRGVDSSPNDPDSTLSINLTNMDKMSFSGLPTPDKFDLTTILTHEILHGLAFTGNLEMNSPLKTAYDALVAPQSVESMFVGRHAVTTNSGRPIPLTSANAGLGSAYYHIALPSDLMSESIKKGEVKSISALDIAMLEDMGIAVTGVRAPLSPKVQTAYNTPALNPSANLQNLMSSLSSNSELNDVLEKDFTNFVQSLGESSLLPSVNLQDFLTQLSTNVQNGNLLPNDSGFLFSATA